MQSQTTAAAALPSDMGLSEFFERHYQPKRLRGALPQTINQFRCTLRAFDRHLVRPATLDDLSDETVTDFLWARINAGKTLETAIKNAKNLLALWRLAHRRKLVQNWPEGELPVRPERIPRALTEDELQRLFSVVLSLEGEIGGIPAAGWWNALFRVIWDTGERIGAVLKLRWCDIDLHGRYLVSRAETRKWKRRDKGWPIGDDTAAALRAIRKPVRELAFPWNRCPSRLYYYLSKITTAAGLPNSREFKFHAVRKSVASHFAARGGDATALLDHSSASVTKLYLDPRIVKPVSACDVLFRVNAVPHDEPIFSMSDPRPSEHSIVLHLNGGRHAVGTAQAAMLKLLQDSPGGVEVHDLIDQMRKQGFADRTVWRSLTLLANSLRKIYRLPKTHEPIRREKTGRKFRREKTGQNARSTAYTVTEEIVSLNLPPAG